MGRGHQRLDQTGLKEEWRRIVTKSPVVPQQPKMVTGLVYVGLVANPTTGLHLGRWIAEFPPKYWHARKILKGPQAKPGPKSQTKHLVCFVIVSTVRLWWVTSLARPCPTPQDEAIHWLLSPVQLMTEKRTFSFSSTSSRSLLFILLVYYLSSLTIVEKKKLHLQNVQASYMYIVWLLFHERTFVQCSLCKYTRESHREEQRSDFYQRGFCCMFKHWDQLSILSGK